MKSKLSGFILLLMLFSTGLYSQLTIDMDPQVERMVIDYIAHNKSIKDIKGWRIQVFALDDRRAMERARDKFEKSFPEIETKWQHSEPYYLLKCAAFRTKLEALPLLHRIKENFPSALVVVDDIKPKELVEEYRY